MLEWNNSALMELQHCGEKFRRKYLENERMPPSPRMLRGTVVHKVGAMALLRKLEEQTLPSVQEARDLASDEFDVQWAGGVSFDQEPTAESAGQQKGASKDFATDLSALFVSTVAPKVEPVAVERKITVRPKDSDLVIHGTMDLIEKRPDGEAIRDWKTSEKSPAKSAADDSQQLSMYAMLRQAEVGTAPVQLSLDYLVRTPERKDVKHVRLDTTRDAGDVTALVHRLNTAVEAVKRGTFMPAAPDWWGCSARWCEFFKSCPYTAKGRNRPHD